MAKPDWKRTATTWAPLLAATGSVATVAFLPHAAGAAASYAAIAESLGTNLLASGVAAFCRNPLRPQKERRETLANHDIRNMIKVSWGEAALASLNAYCETHPTPPLLSVTSIGASAAFHHAVAKLKPGDFLNGEPDVVTINTAVAAARRALLPEDHAVTPADETHETTPSEEAVQQHISGLTAALIDSVLATVAKHLGEDPLPQDLKDFLAGMNGAEPVPSLLDQLCIYVAYYLKTNPRAQTAVLHYTLQQISDLQVAAFEDQKQRLDQLCQTIHDTQNALQTSLIDSFAKQQAQAAKRIAHHIDQALNQFVQPVLNPPFDDPGASDDFRFTFRRRRTRMVGREDAMDELLQFMADPRPGSWTVISGQAGCGKSRLAAELISQVRNPGEPYTDGVPAGQWRAGFLRSGDNWLKGEASRWTADADTLIVIDYAAEADEKDLVDFLAHLGLASQAVPLCQVRAILIDRLPPDGPRGLATRLLTGRDSAAQADKNRWSSRSAVSRPDLPPSPTLAEDRPSPIGSAGAQYLDPLALEPVAESDALQIVQDWAGAKLSNPQKQQIQNAIALEPELARPLFAALMGDAISHDALPPGALDPVSVASSALQRLFKPEAQLPECAPCLSQTQDLLAAVTASQGVPEEDLFDDDQALSNLIGQPSPAGAELTSLHRCLGQFSPYSGNRFGPLEPDFLGGLFVLKSLTQQTTYKRALARAELLMSFAWAHGQGPDAFLVRLASDFFGRADQLQRALAQDRKWLTPARIHDLLVTLILSGLAPEAIKGNGPAAVGYAVYLASRAGQPQTASRIMDALETVYSSTESRIDPLVMAQAWFGLACSGDLPQSATSRAQEALERIGQLRAQHDTPEIALALANAFFNAIIDEQDPRCREALAERIGELLKRHDTPEIALTQAQAFYSVTVRETDPRRREALADRIGELLTRHNTPEIALEQAKGLRNATADEPDPRRREALADRIGELLTRHNTPEIALEQAKALMNVTVRETDPRRSEAIADRIAELLTRHNTPEIALQQAMALANATADETDPRRREALADRIGELLVRHNTQEIALEQAKALMNATADEPDPRRREALADRIGELLTRHNTPEIALQQAMALMNVTFRETDPRRCEALADRIGELLTRHDTPEIALRQAKALMNVTVRETDPRRREALADRIGELLTRHNTPEIALEQAKGLRNATADEPDPRRREALADRIGELLTRHNTPEIALEQAKALMNVTVRETDPRRSEAIADRIAELLTRHNTPEIALQQAKALMSATVVETDPRRCEALADRIGELLTRHNTPEIALEQAMALMNATVDETDPRRSEALADRIGELLTRHNTPEIALRQAKALMSATVRETDPRRREVLAGRIAELLTRHNTPEIALEQAMALMNVTVRETDPRRSEALADRIGELLTRHNTPEIALEQAKALMNVTVRETDPRRREALVDRIGELLTRHNTPEIALAQFNALGNALTRETEPSRQEILAHRIQELAEKYEAVRNALAEILAKANESNEP